MMTQIVNRRRILTRESEGRARGDNNLRRRSASNPPAGSQYGEIRAMLESKGETIGGNDLWIAAHAKAAGLVLITNNEPEFKRVRGLKVQNWAAPPSTG
jgi:predicted nucleic acid-binding protein